MGFGFIIDDFCVYLGVIVVWLGRGCNYNLWHELKSVEVGEFFSRREGVIGLVSLIATVGIAWIIVKWF